MPPLAGDNKAPPGDVLICRSTLKHGLLCHRLRVERWYAVPKGESFSSPTRAVVWFSHKQHSYFCSWLAALAPPFGALRHHLPPAERWDNKAPRNIYLICGSTLSTGCCATACGGSPAKRARGEYFPSPVRAVVWFSHKWHSAFCSWLAALAPLWCLTAPPSPREAGGQQSSAKHLSHMRLYVKHGLLCHRLRGKGGTQYQKGDVFPSPARAVLKVFS